MKYVLLLLIFFAVSLTAQETYKGEFFRLKEGLPDVYKLKTVVDSTVKSAYFPKDSSYGSIMLYDVLKAIKTEAAENMLTITVDVDGYIQVLDLHSSVIRKYGLWSVSLRFDSTYSVTFKQSRDSKLRVDISNNAAAKLYKYKTGDVGLIFEGCDDLNGSGRSAFMETISHLVSGDLIGAVVYLKEDISSEIVILLEE